MSRRPGVAQKAKFLEITSFSSLYFMKSESIMANIW
jgi:hypothetical protein